MTNYKINGDSVEIIVFGITEINSELPMPFKCKSTIDIGKQGIKIKCQEWLRLMLKSYTSRNRIRCLRT